MHGWWFFTTVAHPAIGSTRLVRQFCNVPDDGNDRVGSCASLDSVGGCEEWRMFVAQNHLGVAAISHHIWSVFLFWYSQSTTIDQPDGLGRQLLRPCWPSPTTAWGKTAAGPGPRQGRHCLFGLAHNICSLLIATLSNEIQNTSTLRALLARYRCAFSFS